MAYLRRRRAGYQTYLYILEARRRGDKVEQVCLEYLGNAAQVTPARLKRALTYWRVGHKRKATRKGGRS
jgi:hypothetical protein